MRMHKRTKPVQLASLEIGTALWKLQEEHGLTYVEMTQALLDHLGRIAKYQLREERHPDDPDKGGDEA